MANFSRELRLLKASQNILYPSSRLSWHKTHAVRNFYSMWFHWQKTKPKWAGNCCCLERPQHKMSIQTTHPPTHPPNQPTNKQQNKTKQNKNTKNFSLLSRKIWIQIQQMFTKYLLWPDPVLCTFIYLFTVITKYLTDMHEGSRSFIFKKNQVHPVDKEGHF